MEIWAIVCGCIAIVVAFVAKNFYSADIAGGSISDTPISGVPKGQIGTAVTTAIHANVPLYVAQLLVGLACSVLGGYVAAWLAKHDELLNGVLSSVLCVALSVYTISTGKDSKPHWLQVLLLVASPLLALLGGDLMRRLRRSRLQLA